MAWLALTFAVDASRVETLSDALIEAGAIAVDVTDAHAGTPAEHALFGAPGEPAAGPWASSSIRALFEDTDSVAALATATLRAAGLEPAIPVEVSRVADQDWV